MKTSMVGIAIKLGYIELKHVSVVDWGTSYQRHHIIEGWIVFDTT